MENFQKVSLFFFSPLATFSMTPDLVPYKEWEQVLAHFKFINIGSRPSHYPSDARALVKWSEPLRKWVEENRQPILSHLCAEEIYNMSEVIGNAYQQNNII